MDLGEEAITEPLVVRLTGDVALERDGVGIGRAHLRSRQARLVLALLVLERARPVGRDEVAELIWPGERPASWESVLRTAVTRVRAALAEAGLSGRDVLRSEAGGYRVTLPPDVVVDVERAEADIAEARAADRLTEAEAVTGAPFLPGVDGAWAVGWRTRLRGLRVRALAAVSTARTAGGDHAGAVVAARTAIDLDPFGESGHRLLMSALAAGGDRAQALVAYERCRTLLADELGTDPAAATEAVFLSLLAGAARPPDRPELPARLRAEAAGLLVGRVREVQLVQETAVVREPAPVAVVAIAGEAGVGKTALVAHALTGTDALVLYGRCDEQVTLAYRPVVECLAQLAAHLPDAVLVDHTARYGSSLPRLVPELRQGQAEPGTDPRTERHLLFRSVAALLTRAAADRPVVLVVDDLHWADKPTLLLLRHLADSAGPGLLSLVVTCRPGDLTDDADGALRELLRGPAACRITLSGLADDDLVPLVEAVAGRPLGMDAAAWAHAIGRECGGNPFFARELLRNLAETGWATTDPARIALTETVRDVVGHRVDRLGPATAAVLTQAAVAGAEFDLPVLAAAVECTEDAMLDHLDRAVAAGLVTELPADRFAFGHALVQRTLCERVGAARRRRMHRRVALALEATDSDRVGELARHWLLGHRPDEARVAADRACRAGDRALTDLAPDQALRWFTDALPLLDADDPLRVDALIGLGTAQRGTGEQDYRQTLLAAGRLAEAADDTTRLVRAAVANNRGSVSNSGRLDADRIALLESAIAAIGDDPHPQRPLLGATLAVELLAADQADRRARLADDAVDRARALGDPLVLGRVLALRFEATWAPSTQPRRLTDTAELLTIAATAPDRRLKLLAARLRSIACWEAGLIAESDAALAEEIRIADDIGEPYLRWVAALSHAGRTLAAGGLTEAEAACEAAFRMGNDAGEPDAALAYGAQVMQLRRQQGRGAELLPVLRGLDGMGDYDLRPATALILVDAGELNEARTEVGDLFDDLPSPDSQLRVQLLCQLAEVAHGTGDPTAAQRVYDRLLPCTGLLQLNQVVRYGPIDHQLGLASACAGDRDAAVRHLTAAVAVSAAVPLPYWLERSEAALVAAGSRAGVSVGSVIG
ncbi:ATP-binding protein [Actinokineospora inagensis]|uniref:ATP-binding protein n=1 Tax=Actinokineospora inagensis TaxID=103730 RepID=UPI0004076581|nr:AAA family ATPase [Actinokineospora inagensis]